MKTVSVQKIAEILRILVLITFFCNIVALFLVPGLVYFHFDAAREMDFSQLQAVFAYDIDDGLGWLLTIYLAEVWREPYTMMLTLFLLFSGVCTASILAQITHVLYTIVEAKNPFCMENAVSLNRAAAFCFAIAAAALIRVVFSVWYFRTLQPLASYNALFVPMFAMGGLLCMVMSALFRQAAELKAENDLTI